MRPSVLLLSSLLGSLLIGGCSNKSPVVVHPSQARAVRIRVEAPRLEGPVAECSAHYPMLQRELPGAVERALVQGGFTVLPANAPESDLVAEVSARLTECRPQGTCIRGVTDVSLISASDGALLEQIRYDNRTTPCELSPAVGELSGVIEEQVATRSVRSQRLSALAVRLSAPAPPSPPAPLQPEPAAQASVEPPAPVATVSPPVALPEFVQGPSHPEAYALVVGIEQYRDLPPPTGARADALGFAKLAAESLGVPQANIISLIDERATRSDIEKSLSWLALNVPENGRVYFFYSGHGAPDPVNGTPYVLPYDGDPRALPETALPLSVVAEKLGQTKAHDALAFVDSCFSGLGGRSVLPEGTRPLVRVQQVPAPRGLSILSSADSTQIAGASTDGSGLFTKYLLQGLGQNQADLDADGKITLSELHRFVAPRVEGDARREHRLQTPTLFVPDGAEAGQIVVQQGRTP